MDYEQKVINILKAGKGGKSLSRDSYHILKTYKLVTLGGVNKVAKNEKYMANKDEVINLIRTVCSETGHGGERKTNKKLLDLYCNSIRNLVHEYIQHCETCVEK